MNADALKSKIKDLISDEPSGWLEDADYYDANKYWMEKSALIAVKILSAIRNQSVTQKELAEAIGVTPQYINKVLKGRENLSLATISKIERSLSISLISIPEFQNSQVIADSFVSFPQVISRNNSLLLGTEKMEYKSESNYHNAEDNKAA
jgi:transcriptional regulator with XRE-family HTH domain